MLTYPGQWGAVATDSSDCAPRLHNSAETLPHLASAARVGKTPSHMAIKSHGNVKLTIVQQSQTKYV